MECLVRGVLVNYEEMGEGRPILMLHGWPADHRQMIYDMEPFFANRPGWRRLYPDMPGMGRTPGADWIKSQDDMLEVALGFIDAVAPGARFAVAGASYGGYLARGVVYRRSTQVCGVMLDVPSMGTDTPTRRLPPHQILVHDPAFEQALGPDEQLTATIVVVQSPAALEHFREAIKPGVSIADHAFLESLEPRYDFSFPVDTLPEPFPAPTLIITGRQDSSCGYLDTWSLIENYPRGSFIVLDRAGHALSVEQATLFRALVNEWLDRMEEYEASARD